MLTPEITKKQRISGSPANDNGYNLENIDLAFSDLFEKIFKLDEKEKTELGKIIQNLTEEAMAKYLGDTASDPTIAALSIEQIKTDIGIKILKYILFKKLSSAIPSEKPMRNLEELTTFSRANHRDASTVLGFVKNILNENMTGDQSAIDLESYLNHLLDTVSKPTAENVTRGTLEWFFNTLDYTKSVEDFFKKKIVIEIPVN